VIRKLIWLVSLCCVTSANASPFGINIIYPLVAKEPSDLKGYRIGITYQPCQLMWKKAQIYFDAGYGHWWINGSQPYSSLSIYSIAPYVRIYFWKTSCLSPYFEGSVGFSYLTKTRIEDRNQGIHFSFQDQIGLGVAYGAEQRFYTTLSVLHYSNASLSNHNQGMTLPLILNMGYRF
jgi:hypothetical protein